MAEDVKTEPPADLPPPPRHRWARREVWFVLLVVVVIAGALFARQYVNPARPADGPPLGGLSSRPDGAAAPTPG